MTLIKVPKHKEYICNICGEKIGYHDKVYSFASDKRIRAPKHTEHEDLHMCDDCAERFFRVVREEKDISEHNKHLSNPPNCSSNRQYRRSELMQDIVDGVYNPYKNYER